MTGSVVTRRTALNLLLLLAVAALAALAWLGPNPHRKPTVVRISTLRPQQIHTVRVQRSGGTMVVLRRRGKAWRVTAPRDLPADAERVNLILALAETPSHAHYPLGQIDPKALGLDPPHARVYLDGEAFLFGAQEPVSYDRYVQHGNTVYLITDTLFHELADGPAGYADPRLLPEQAPIIALQLPDLRLTKAGGGRWRLEPPRPGLSADAVNTLVDEWHVARAMEVRLAGAVTGHATIQVTLAGRSTPITFELIARAPELLLVRPDLGLEYRLPADAARRLLQLAPPGEPSTSP